MSRARLASTFAFPWLAAALAAQAKPDPDKTPASPAVQAAVDRATKELTSDWDWFATDRLAVVYQFEPKRQGSKAKALSAAKHAATTAGLLLARFERDFPPHDEMKSELPYLRLFADLKAREAYVGSDPNKAWSELNRRGNDGEIVDGDVRFLWVHYCYRWFGGKPPAPEQWFLHTAIRVYSGLRLDGATLRFQPPDLQHARRHVAATKLETFLSYDGSAAKEPQEIASMAMVFADMLERGPKKLGKKFDPKWSRILPAYGLALRTRRDAKEARAAAFDGIDPAGLQAAIRAWAAAN